MADSEERPASGEHQPTVEDCDPKVEPSSQEEPEQPQNGESHPEPSSQEETEAPEQSEQQQQQQEGSEEDIQSQPKNEPEGTPADADASKVDKKAEEQRKKEEKQRERELEKERKLKEKATKEEQKRRAKADKDLKKKRKKEAEVQVTLLDGNRYECVVPRKCKASAIFDEVYRHLDIEERDYFGLYYLDNNVKVYIDPLKTAKRQIPIEEDSSWKLFFGVKYYIEDPTTVKEDITRYQYVMQICQDIKAQRIKATKEQIDELMSLVVQSSVGDYNPEEHPAGYTEEFQAYFYIKKDAMPEGLEEVVVELHKAKRETSPSDCEMEFLKLSKSLPRYGVHTYSAQDDRAMQAILGISFKGLSIYQDSKETHKFDWSDIVRVGFSKKKFKIWFDPSIQFPEDHKPALLDLWLHNQAAAKRLWVICAEQHTFFRRSAPVVIPKAAGFFSFKRGSKFRYSGRTLKQMKESDGRSDQPEFKRTYSERYSRPAAKKAIRRTASLENVGTSNMATVEVEQNDPDLNKEEQAEVVRKFLESEKKAVADNEPTNEPASEEPPSEAPQQQTTETPHEAEVEVEPQATTEESTNAESQPEPVSERPPTPPPAEVEGHQEPSGGHHGDDDSVEVAEHTIEMGDPDADENVEEDAKALVGSVLDDVTQKVEDED